MGGATSAQTRVDEDDAGWFPSLPRRLFAFSPLELDHCPCNARMDLNYRDRLKSGVVDDLLVLLHPLRHHLQTSVCGVVSSPFAPRHRAHLPYERIAPARQSSTLLLLDCDVYCLPLAAREDLPGVEGGEQFSFGSEALCSVAPRPFGPRLPQVSCEIHIVPLPVGESQAEASAK